jgi:Glycine zipper
MKRVPSILFATLLLLVGAQPAVQAQTKRRSVVIPSGTEVQMRLNSQLDTAAAKAGQTFEGSVAEPVVVNGRTAIAKGATVNGRVVEAVSSGRLKKPASITLELTSVSTEPLRIDGKSHLVRNAELIGGGAAAGAVIGAIAGGKKGALIGSAVGAGAGTATAYMTGKKEIVLPPEILLTFVVSGNSSFSAPAVKTAGASSSGEPSKAGESYRAGKRSKGQDYSSDNEDDQGGGSGGGLPVFTTPQRKIIRSYYSDTSNLPPGLAKRGGHLPPGLEKHLQRDGTLPPGLQKRVEPFPAELSRQLPKLPSGYSRVILSGRALILDRNNKILDIMALAVH